MSVVVALVRSRRNTFNGGGDTVAIRAPLGITTKLSAELANRTNRPSGLMMGEPESPSPGAAAAAALLTDRSWRASAPRQFPHTVIEVTAIKLCRIRALIECLPSMFSTAASHATHTY